VAPDLDQRSRPAVSPVAAVLAGCSVLALVSLVAIPSTITFDPLTWATWAREIVHLNLNTNGGPAWKPLPVVVDVIFAPFGSLSKWVWLAVARAGALLGVAMAYRLAKRLAGTWAGLAAAAGFLLSESLLEYLAPLGMSEPLLAGLALLAIERHLDDHLAQAYALIYACLLLRPETFPFFAGYSVFLWRRSRAARPWVVVLTALLPVFWLLPDYLATGNALRSSQRAAMPTQGGPLLTGHPALAVIESAFNAVVLPVVVGAVFAMALAGVRWWRRREEPVLAALSLLCLGWLIVVALETQAHFGSGDQRYLIVSYALACVLAGVGWTRVVALVADRLAGRAWAPTAVIVVVALASAPFVVQRLQELSGDVGEVPYQAHKYGELQSLIDHAGRRRQILACGPVSSDIYQMPALAWDLGIHQSQIVIATATSNVPTKGTVFRTRTTRGSPVVPPVLGSADFRVVATTDQWQLLSTCDNQPH
jgi:hypothetical protein